ncbi:MAG: cellulose biosynthesis cyclic di-GMP-binding regulatory protein BcsB, partial [Duodenibacillus sp.]
MTDFARFSRFSWQGAALALVLAASTAFTPWCNDVRAAPQPTASLRSDGAASSERTLALFDLAAGGKVSAVRLTGLAPARVFDFGVRRDEIVTSALLHLVWTSSPALLAGKSQLNVRLNDRLIKTIPLAASSMGEATALDIPIPAALIGPAGNRLRLELIGHYQSVCENDAHTALWLELADESSLTLAGESVRIANDLSVLPAPFVDAADLREAVVPMVFAASPDESTRTAAAIAAGVVGIRSA